MENFSKKKLRDDSIVKLLNIHRIVDNDIFLLFLLQDYYQLTGKLIVFKSLKVFAIFLNFADINHKVD